MTFEQAVRDMINNPILTYTDNKSKISLYSKPNEDSSASIYMRISCKDYSYPLYVANYNPYYSIHHKINKEQIENDILFFLKKHKSYFEGNWREV